MLIEGNDDELVLAGALTVGPGGGVGIVVAEGADEAVPLKGDGVGGAAAAAGGAVCAFAFIVAVKRTIPATAPWRRSHRPGMANVDSLGIIAGDP